jgi:integrase/recombinase XerD
VLADIEKIYKYQAESMSTEEWARDLWLFSYLCNGINPKDIARLTYQQVGSKSIQFVRAKTERTRREVKAIHVTISDDVWRIISKWGQTPTSPHKYVFAILKPGMTAREEMATIRQTTKTINFYIRRIAQSVGIEKDVTTYTARHSFATVLKRSGASNEYIGESLGHSDLKSTENYLDSFEDDLKQHFASALLNFNKQQ